MSLCYIYCLYVGICWHPQHISPLPPPPPPPPRYMAIPPFHLFSKLPLLPRLFPQYRPNEIPDKYKNKLIWQSYFFIFNRLKNNDSCFFNTYISNIRLKCNPKSTISNIKRSQNKNKHSK